jgi:protein gp37
MVDGSIAECYAETMAERVAQNVYPNGFEHHYWRPDVLNDPLRIKSPSLIFLDSMSDLVGHWVPDEQVEMVLEVCRQSHWHSFQLLTYLTQGELN